MATYTVHEGNDGFFFVVLILVVLGLFFLVPGMLLLSLPLYVLSIESLDVGQMWTFSLLASIAMFLGFLLFSRLFCESWGKTFGVASVIYAVSGFLIVFVFAVSHFGFKAAFPMSMLAKFLSGQ